MTRYPSLVLVLIVASPIALAEGCGENEKTPQTEAPVLTREEFIAQADEICRSAGQELNARAEQEGFYVPSGRPVREEETKFIEEEIIPTFQRQFDEIRQLTPPPDDEAKIEAALSAAERGLEDLLENPSRVPRAVQELNRLLERYGSGACVN